MGGNGSEKIERIGKKKYNKELSTCCDVRTEVTCAGYGETAGIINGLIEIKSTRQGDVPYSLAATDDAIQL